MYRHETNKDADRDLSRDNSKPTSSILIIVTVVLRLFGCLVDIFEGLLLTLLDEFVFQAETMSLNQQRGSNGYQAGSCDQCTSRTNERMVSDCKVLADRCCMLVSNRNHTQDVMCVETPRSRTTLVFENFGH